MNDTYNNEWWFFKSYLISTITFPLIYKISKRFSLYINMVLIVIASIMVTNVLPAISNLEVLGNLSSNFLYSSFFCQRAPFIACFWAGIVIAKDNGLVKLYNTMKEHLKLNIIVDVFIVCLIVFARFFLVDAVLDILYVPVLIVVIIDFISHFKWLNTLLISLGKESTNMWLIHSFLCYYFSVPAKIVTYTGWGVPSLLTLIILSYLLSVCTTYIWKFIGFLHDKGINAVQHRLKLKK